MIATSDVKILNRDVSAKSIFLLITPFLLLTILFFVYGILNKEIPFLTIAMACVAFTIRSYKMLRNKVAFAYLQNGNLIVRVLERKKSIVTELRCVKKVKTRKLFGLTLTLIHIKFDGQDRNHWLLGLNPDGQTAEDLLQLEIKNKRKSKS